MKNDVLTFLLVGLLLLGSGLSSASEISIANSIRDPNPPFT